MIELRRSSATKAAAITAAPLLCRFTDFFVSRFHSNSATAAQPHPDSDSDDDDYSSSASSDSNYYDYYYNNRKPPRRYGSNPMSSDSEAFVPTNPVQWSFIGNPSAKRHVFAQRIFWKSLAFPFLPSSVKTSTLAPLSTNRSPLSSSFFCFLSFFFLFLGV